MTDRPVSQLQKSLFFEEETAIAGQAVEDAQINHVAVNEDESVKCPHCGSNSLRKNGKRAKKDGSISMRFECKDCGKQFSVKA